MYGTPQRKVNILFKSTSTERFDSFWRPMRDRVLDKQSWKLKAPFIDVQSKHNNSGQDIVGFRCALKMRKTQSKRLVSSWPGPIKNRPFSTAGQLSADLSKANIGLPSMVSALSKRGTIVWRLSVADTDLWYSASRWLRYVRACTKCMFTPIPNSG